MRIYLLTLEVPGLSQPLYFDDLNVSVSGIGEQTIVVNYGGRVSVVKGQEGRVGMLKGQLEVLDSDERTHRVALSLPYQCNW